MELHHFSEIRKFDYTKSRSSDCMQTLLFGGVTCVPGTALHLCSGPEMKDFSGKIKVWGCFSSTAWCSLVLYWTCLIWDREAAAAISPSGLGGSSGHDSCKRRTWQTPQNDTQRATSLPLASLTFRPIATFYQSVPDVSQKGQSCLLSFVKT